ncbi:MAG TPA: M20 family metallopeptidase [Myxococcaceae bacterium]|nr:M20 family metallopeptidase [Myxococcaceae bacterium]
MAMFEVEHDADRTLASGRRAYVLSPSTGGWQRGAGGREGDLNAIELTRELLRINTINPTHPERPCAEKVAGLLEAAGYSVSLHEFAPGRTSVWAALEGAGAPLCLAGHLDTVPLGGARWSKDPFAGEVDGPKLYGRGASDMKSGVAAMVAAALEVARLPNRKAGLTLALVAGEETGCEGSAHLARTVRLGRAGALVVGEPTGNRPVIGHKGALWLRARTSGVTAHGSMPHQGVNAIYKAARAALQLEEIRFDVTPDPLLGAPTLNVGTFSGGININSVPDEAMIGIDVRTIPAQRHADVRALLARVLGPDVELTPIVDVEGVRTPESDSFVRRVCEAAANVTGQPAEPGAATYFTDASVLTPALGAPPTVVLGPGEHDQCHKTDEWCRTDRIEQAVDIYTSVARAWCER